jgi:alpha-tubulin suppressor-like RCC1 family protein
MRRSTAAYLLAITLTAPLACGLSACGDDDVTPPTDLGVADAGPADLGVDLGVDLGPRDLGVDSGPVVCTVGCAIVKITAGLRHTCALRESGEVVCWGDNYYSELGDDRSRHSSCPPTFDALSTDCQARPVAVSGIADVTDLEAHLGPTTCGLTSAGGWKCWGLEFISTGTGQPAQLNVATADPRFDGITQVGAAWGNACGVTGTGTVSCLGGNQFGQIGDGTTTERRLPVAVPGLAGVAEVHSSGSHTCARLTDGTLRCWGVNESGQLGDGLATHGTVRCSAGSTTLDCSSSPVTVATVTDATSLAVAGDSSCALRADGTVWCWGANFFGQLGSGTLLDSNTPVPVSGLTGATALAAGGNHFCALVAGGAIKCWGLNYEGQLGDDAAHETCSFGGTSHDCSKLPVNVPGVTGATALALGSSHSCALVSGGVTCWGNNIVYQAGVPTGDRVPVPTLVAGIP